MTSGTPSLSQAASKGGTTARPWNQLAREWANAEKAAAASVVASSAGGRTARGGNAEGSRRKYWALTQNCISTESEQLQHQVIHTTIKSKS